MNPRQWPEALRARFKRGPVTPAPVINFLQKKPTVGWLVALLWAVALALCVTVWDNWLQLQDKDADTARVEAQFTAMALKQQKLIQASIQTSPQQKKQLEAFTQQKATPYALLTTLEQAWSPQVALLRLELEPVTQEVDMDIESKDLADTFRFIERLKRQGTVDVYLQHSAVNTQDPMNPTVVKLRLSAR